MKKYFFVGFILVFLLAGCGNDSYSLERKYWQAQRQAQNIIKNPTATPARELEKTVSALQQFERQYPQKNIAVESAFTIARLYIVKEEYDEARATIHEFLQGHKTSDAVSSEGIFVIGNSYEAQDRWDDALEQYKSIMEKFPATARGIDIPVYIAQHYRIKHEPDKMLAAFREAAEHYVALADKHPNTPLALNCHTLATQCYITVKDWQSALNLLDNMVIWYKDKIDPGVILINKAMIYAKEMKDVTKAKEILESIKKDYPSSKTLKAVDQILKGLDK